MITALGAALLAAPACASKPSKPSLLLVVMEGVRADHMSVYGYVRPTTPRTEVLASEGAVYESAYTSSPSTAGALGSILTGRYPPEHGFFLSPKLNPKVTTLAETLGGAGYLTHAISSEPMASRDSGVLRGFDEIESIDPTESEDLEGGAAEVTRKAEAFIAGHRGGDKPFFLLLLYSSPTLPFHPPDAIRYRFVDPIINKQRVEILSQYWIRFADRFNARDAELSSRELDILKDLYDAEIAYADEQVGSVVKSLREARLLDGTLVILTSDRGEDLGEQHHLADASSLREANLRVPLVVRFPPRIEAGKRIAGLAQDVDLAPTVCDLLGVAKPASLTRLSASLVPQDGSTKRRTAFSVALERAPDGNVALVMSARDAQYRFVLAPSGPQSLHDLKADPDQTVNLLEKDESKAASLTAALKTWDSSLTAAGGAPPPSTEGAPPQGKAPPAPGAPPAPAGPASGAAAPAPGSPR